MLFIIFLSTKRHNSEVRKIGTNVAGESSLLVSIYTEMMIHAGRVAHQGLKCVRRGHFERFVYGN